MQIGVVGLGRMGANIARRLMRHGHACVVHDVHESAVQALVKEGAQGAGTLDELLAALQGKPAVVWVMLPAGAVTEDVVARLGARLAAGDIVIDGGNSFYRDDIRRAGSLAARGVRYVDVGTSGGVWGLERGYCMMIGGERAAVEHLQPVFEALAPGAGAAAPTPGREHDEAPAVRGYIHAGPVGAGHFVKMVHNGIEYGLMQAYAEGFQILHSRAGGGVPEAERYAFDLADIAEVWRRGSVVSSWLLDLTAAALARDPQLGGFSGRVEDSGEGRWTLDAAVEQAVPAPVLAASLFARFRSREAQSFSDQMLSAMRLGFGGHVEPGKG
ncbi:MAG: decarboxylating 6-phosphogluconate dehydrogenase [Nevskia sp.]|nr:decarboxylating 6-phosphogluconate dehydrogenase [Nevskia sp.]